MLSCNPQSQKIDDSTKNVLHKLSTSKATQYFFQRAYYIDEECSKLCSDFKLGKRFTDDGYSEFMKVFYDWSIFWRDIAYYYSNFSPKNLEELYGEFYTVMNTASYEACNSCDFNARAFISPDYLRIKIGLLELRRELIEIAKEIKIVPTNRYLNDFQTYEKLYPFKDGLDIAKTFMDFCATFESLRSWDNETEKEKNLLEMRKKLRYQYLFILSASNYLNSETKSTLDELCRVDMCLSIMDNITMHILCYVENERIHQLRGKILELKLKKVEANVKILNKQ